MENRIKLWRRRRGLSQEALGARVGLGKASISKLERGEMRLRDVTIAKLVDALDVSAADLLGDYAGGPAGLTGEAAADEAAADEADFGFRRVPLADKAALVGDVFSSVAGRYDLMNDLMSAGVHRAWKNAMVDWLAPRPGWHVADVAGGTGDIAARIRARRPDAAVTVCDINPAMIAAGRDRAIDQGLYPAARGLDFICADAEALPLADGCLDAYTIAFGIRNVTRIPVALTEARRVLKPGGRFLCLEFSRVALPALATLYDAYSFKILPAIGGLVAGDRDAYRYLAESIRRFPDQQRFSDMITAAGLGRCRYRNLSGGIAALHSAWRI